MLYNLKIYFCVRLWLYEAEKLIQSLTCKPNFSSVYVCAMEAVSLAEQKDKRVRVYKDFRCLENLEHQRTSILYTDLFQSFLTLPENTSKEPIAWLLSQTQVVNGWRFQLIAEDLFQLVKCIVPTHFNILKVSTVFRKPSLR